VELRHLRYFVAIAEEGSFTQAAEKRLHTAQPSLSRQIRDLETELAVQLIDRGPRGMDLTNAGRVFLDHARSILLQVEAAAEAARRAARPAKTPFTVGFLTGHEIGWLPKVMEILRDELGTVELIVHSGSSPDLMQGLLNGTMDVAFVRPDQEAWGLAFKLVTNEPLFVLMPADHRLAQRPSIGIEELAGQPFINYRMDYAPALRRVIDEYLKRSATSITAAHDAEGLPMVISLVLATGGVSLTPIYLTRLLPPTVISRPLIGTAPTVPLAMGYNTANPSPLLKLFLERADAFIAPSLARSQPSS
jgi:LysR family hca operon transcriptional activator